MRGFGLRHLEGDPYVSKKSGESSEFGHGLRACSSRRGSLVCGLLDPEQYGLVSPKHVSKLNYDACWTSSEAAICCRFVSVETEKKPKKKRQFLQRTPRHAGSDDLAAWPCCPKAMAHNFKISL